MDWATSMTLSGLSNWRALPSERVMVTMALSSVIVRQAPQDNGVPGSGRKKTPRGRLRRVQPRVVSAMGAGSCHVTHPAGALARATLPYSIPTDLATNGLTYPMYGGYILFVRAGGRQFGGQPGVTSAARAHRCRREPRLPFHHEATPASAYGKPCPPPDQQAAFAWLTMAPSHHSGTAVRRKGCNGNSLTSLDR